MAEIAVQTLEILAEVEIQSEVKIPAEQKIHNARNLILRIINLFYKERSGLTRPFL